VVQGRTARNIAKRFLFYFIEQTMTVIEITTKSMALQDAALSAYEKTERQIWTTWTFTALICCVIILWDYWTNPNHTVWPWVVGLLLTVMGGTFLYTTIDLMFGDVGSHWTTFPTFFFTYCVGAASILAISVYIFSDMRIDPMGNFLSDRDQYSEPAT
jgi:MFS superfamily sulfate permease-like transporter